MTGAAQDAGDRQGRRQRGDQRERRFATTAVASLCAVPVLMVVVLVSTFRLPGGSEETPGAVLAYEALLVVAPLAFLAAMVFGIRTGRGGVVVLALTMVPVVLVAAYVFAVPQGRWSGGFQAPGRDVPACYSGTDSCAEYGG